MNSLTLEIHELEKEISEFQKKLDKDTEKSKKIDLEISQVKFLEGIANCFLNDEKRLLEASRINFKNIHEAYQKLSITQSLEYEISNRREELLQEKEKLESQLGQIELKRGTKEKDLEELKTQAMIQRNKKKAMILKLQNNVRKSEEAREQALAKLSELKKKKSS